MPRGRRSGSAVRSVLDRAHDAGVIRADFGYDDLAALMVAVAAVMVATALSPYAGGDPGATGAA